MKSPPGSVATVSPAYAPDAAAKTPIENAIATANTDAPSFGVFPRGVAGGRGSLARVILENLGADVAGLVNAVAEAHDPLLAVQGLLDPAFRVLGRADLLEHLPGLATGPGSSRKPAPTLRQVR